MLIKFGGTKKRLLSNFAHMSLVQIANYLLPLITLPYLVRVLGPERFGIVVFAQIILQYFQFLINYGFNLSATREVSLNRDDGKELDRIVNTVLAAKLFLVLVSFSVLILIVGGVTKLRSDWVIYVAGSGVLVGSWLLPVWYFMGTEKMKVIAIVGLLTKTCFVLGVFIFIRSSEDYHNVLLLQSITAIVGGLLALSYVFKIEGRCFHVAPVKEIALYLKNSFYVFVNSAASSLYLLSTGLFLGVFSGAHVLGVYAGAEKIVNAISNIYMPLSQTLYPYFCKLAIKDDVRYYKYFRILLIVSGILALLAFVIIFIFSTDIVIFVLGKDYIESVVILQALSLLPFVSIFRKVVTVQGLMVYSDGKLIAILAICGGILGLTIMPITVSSWGSIGAAICLTFIELLIGLVAVIFYFKKRREQSANVI